ncbi:MAG: ATP-dependent helicase, partial [Candidatus Theseobacter exili]|nr:ATP-dependent helicase [Candidatus Theseobacter exili]
MKHPSGHALVLAGAGTGKTRTIIYRIAHLIDNGIDPKRILLLTFTRRAAKEMTDRLRKMVGDSANNIISGTFHHYCLMTMRRMQKDFGIVGATVIDLDDQEQLMKLARAQYASNKNIFPKAEVLIKLYSYARNTNQPRLNYLKKFTEHEKKTVDKILKVFEDYDQRKKTYNYLDFDDILYRFAKHLNSNTNPSIRNNLRKRYDHILVDEMQDTNPLQWLILDGLRDPAQLFCVGDDAQSIYAFRGADFRNVHSFTQRCPDSTILKLQENYRSTQEILDLSNWLLKESPLKYNKKLIAYRGKGIKPRLVEFKDDLSEAVWIVSDLLERYENGSKWKDHVIITRSAAASRPVEAELIAK